MDEIMTGHIISSRSSVIMMGADNFSDASHIQNDPLAEAQVHNKVINEEYKIWKKNAVFLYDIMYR